MSVDNLRDEAVARFREAFGGPPDVVSIAPGRTNLIGEHTDYHEGFVFPAAIDRYMVVAARQSKRNSRLISAEVGESGAFTLVTRAQLPDPTWAAYAAGTGVLLCEDGVDVPQIEATVVTNIPFGSGLSSSAAIEVAFAKIFTKWTGLERDRLTLARLCQKSENEVVGVPCGIMDQIASLCGVEGHALFIDTREPIQVVPAPLPEGVTIVICNTGTQHQLGDSGYPIRRRQSENAARLLGFKTLRDVPPEFVARATGLTEVESRRAMHVVTENLRCQEFHEALLEGRLDRLGILMKESHESMRDDYEITTELIDATAEFCWEQPGCVGARMTGGGFGGSVVALVEETHLDTFSASVEGFFRDRAAARSSVFACHASRGAWLE